LSNVVNPHAKRLKIEQAEEDIRTGKVPPSEIPEKIVEIARDYAELQQMYGPQLQERVILMDADAPDGFERVWQINVGFGPERHLGYAVQWFALAAAVLIIYVVVNLKRASKKDDNADV